MFGIVSMGQRGCSPVSCQLQTLLGKQTFLGAPFHMQTTPVAPFHTNSFRSSSFFYDRSITIHPPRSSNSTADHLNAIDNFLVGRRIDDRARVSQNKETMSEGKQLPRARSEINYNNFFLGLTWKCYIFICPSSTAEQTIYLLQLTRERSATACFDHKMADRCWVREDQLLYLTDNSDNITIPWDFMHVILGWTTLHYMHLPVNTWQYMDTMLCAVA